VEESKFPDLGVDHDLVVAMAKKGIVIPTKVQEQVIAPLISGSDILCMSETGSGKTISFAIPTIQIIKPGNGPRVLVVAPTRELAKQIAGEYRKFGRQKGIKTVTIYGGVSMGPQIDKLPDSDVIVGTPGRLLDLARQGYLHLDKIKYLILDECDRMFDMGFIEDIEQIIYATPKDRQMLLFSATISDHIQNITQRYMREAVFVKVEPHLIKGKLNQCYYVMERQQKISVLIHLLNHPKRRDKRTLIFCRTKRMTDLVARALRANRINSAAIHGDVSQARREKTLQDFQEGHITVLVATDVAARGLHIEDIAQASAD
jgi:ATP-dependent RNA helicase DeaD